MHFQLGQGGHSVQASGFGAYRARMPAWQGDVQMLQGCISSAGFAYSVRLLISLLACISLVGAACFGILSDLSFVLFSEAGKKKMLPFLIKSENRAVQQRAAHASAAPFHLK